MAKSIPGQDQDSMRTRLVSILEDLDCDAKFITLMVEYGLIACYMQNQIMAISPSSGRNDEFVRLLKLSSDTYKHLIEALVQTCQHKLAQDLDPEMYERYISSLESNVENVETKKSVPLASKWPNIESMVNSKESKTSHMIHQTRKADEKTAPLGESGMESKQKGVKQSRSVGTNIQKTKISSEVQQSKSYKNENNDGPVPANLIWEAGADVIKDVEYLPGGDIITVGPMADGIHVYDEGGEEVDHPISKLCNGYLTGVSVATKRSTVVVIESRGLDKTGLLHVCKANANTWDHQEYEICNMPRFVTNMAGNTFVIGDYHDVLHKYNTDGEKIWRKELDERIFDMAGDASNRILVCHPNHVTAYNVDGEEEFSFPRNTSQRKIDPYGICVDTEDNILLGDYNSNMVLFYTSEGKFVREILNVDGTPCQMALYSDKYLTVCLDNNKLVMFEI